MRRFFRAGAKAPSFAYLACLSSLTALASAIGCSSILGDFSVGTGAAPDSGGMPDGASADASVDAIDAPAAPCSAAARAPDVYVAQVATADGSPSTGADLTFSWSVRSAPSGSSVTTASLQGATSSAATFVADVAGEYDLVLAVSSPTCAGSTASVSLVARYPQVIFAEGQFQSGMSAADYAVADIDGGNAHALMCADTAVTSTPDGLASFAAYAGRAYDFWEAPSGKPSRFAAFTLDDSDGAYFTHLWTGTSADNCNSPPSDLGTAGFGPGPPLGLEPHFRADGERFVVYDNQWNIVTYPSDGGAEGTVVASYSAGQSSTQPFDASFDPVAYARPAEPPRVEWTATGLAWARASAAGWEIVTAPDTPEDAGFVPTLYMRCAGVPPRQIAMLNDGTVIAAFRQTPGSGEDIYLLKPNISQDCVVEQRYTSSPDAGTSAATDFAVSPDGKWLAFVALDPTTQDAAPWAIPMGGLYPGGYVYVVSIGVPADGGTPQPQQVSSEPAMYGPRWIGGGTRLVFTRLDDPGTGGAPATSVVVVSPDGGGEQVIASGDGKSTFVSTSGSGGCSVGDVRAPDAEWMRGAVASGILAIVAAARVARRRRRPATAERSG
jgi:hypothetical protein